MKHDADVGSNDVDWKRLNSNQAGTKKPFSCAMSVERKPFSRWRPRRWARAHKQKSTRLGMGQYEIVAVDFVCR